MMVHNHKQYARLLVPAITGSLNLYITKAKVELPEQKYRTISAKIDAVLQSTVFESHSYKFYSLILRFLPLQSIFNETKSLFGDY